MSHNNLHNIIPSWLLITAAVFVSFIFCVAIGVASINQVYTNSIMPGVTVGRAAIGGKTIAQARMSIENEIARVQNGVTVTYQNQSIMIPGTNVSLDPDLPVIETVSFDADETLRQSWLVGRDSNWFINVANQIKGFFSQHAVPIVLQADTQAISNNLQTQFASFDKAAQNPSVSFSSGTPTIIPEQNGLRFNFEQATAQIVKQLQSANLETIQLQPEVDAAQVSSKEAGQLLPQIDSYLNIPTLQLTYKEKTWPISPILAKQWLSFTKGNGQVALTLDQTKIKDYLDKKINPSINQDPQDSRLSIDNSKVSVWQSGQDGIKVDNDTMAKLIAQWPASAKATPDKQQTIEIAVTTVASNTSSATADELGLKEIIGTGVSQFAGSPANRRHNIKVGADALNGLLIKPGEEFSLVKALGEVDGQHGYLPELVIKENKTTPEFGGGLCQVGTTMFRATFNSGLPVTARTNHSYRVAYYEPAGTDATIYDPYPDYRFINDTGHYILIQSRMSGNNLAFDFWGTKDGRQVVFTKPTIYNIVPPPPTKTVETTDLPEGQKKCTEKAHNGADAFFDYTVTYPNGDIKHKRFSSHYVPWQAVCLVGVKKIPDTTIPSMPTSTVTPSVTPLIH